MIYIFVLLIISMNTEAKNLKFNKNKIGAYVSGEVIIKFKDTVSTEVQSKFFISTNSIKTKSLFKNLKTHVLKIKDQNMSVQEYIEANKDNPNIEYLTPNYKVYISEVPTPGTLYNNQWGLKNDGTPLDTIFDETAPAYSTNSGTINKDINIEPLWSSRSSDCSSTQIAIIDTGLNPYILDFTGHTITYYNAISRVACDNVNDHGSCTLDLNGHGTHVAGIIAGNAGNDINGVCPIANLLIIKAMSDDGSGDMDDIAHAVDYAASVGAKVANLSLGGIVPTSLYNSDILVDAAKASTNMMLIVAAGNGDYSGQGISSDSYEADGSTYYTTPCAIKEPNIMCIGAVDMNFNRASFSNYSPFSVDIAAPGTDILSSYILNYDIDTSTNLWETPENIWSIKSYNNIDALQFPLSLDISDTVPSSSYTSSINGKFTNLNFLGLDKLIFNFYTTFYLDSATYVNLKLNDSTQVINFYSFDSNDNLVSITLPGEGKNFTGDRFDASYYVSQSSEGCDNADVCSINYSISSTCSGPKLGGFAIYGFTLKGIDNINYNDIQAYESGTSMATPFAVGVYALLKSLFPSKSMNDIASAMIYEGTPFTSDKSFATSNVLNAYTAYQALNTNKLLPPNFIKAELTN